MSRDGEWNAQLHDQYLAALGERDEAIERAERAEASKARWNTLGVAALAFFIPIAAIGGWTAHRPAHYTPPPPPKPRSAQAAVAADLKEVPGSRLTQYVFKSALPNLPIIEARFKLYPTAKQRQFLNQYGYGNGSFYRMSCARFSTTGKKTASFKDAQSVNYCTTTKLTRAEAEAAVPNAAAHRTSPAA